MEHFVPIRKAELVDLLCNQNGLAPGDRVLLAKFAQLLGVTLSVAYHRQLEELTRLYANFDPDADTIAPAAVSAGQRTRRANDLFVAFDSLMERANFVRLKRSDVLHALSARSSLGMDLSIDLDIFERLEIYGRGDVTVERLKRGWRGWWRRETASVPVYQRLAMIFRLRDTAGFGHFVDTDDVYLKLFKDIPKLDLDMLLPGGRFRMTPLDRARILLPTVSGLGLAAWKIAQGALLVAAAGVYGVTAVLGLVAGTVGYGVRSFYGYLRTKEKYQLSLTESLYYQNLDNNAGVIFRLLHEAEEQEHREAMLAYAFLWKHAPYTGWPAERLDQAIEIFLNEAIGRPVDFEVADALDKLVRLRLAEQRPNGCYVALPLQKAIAALERPLEEAADFQRAA